MADKKLMLGHKVRRLRRAENLTQAQMAADLDISPAYLNLIEHNQRPVTAQVLVKLASTYDLDLGSFAKDDEGELIQRMQEIFTDPALDDIRLSRQDYRDLAALSPEVVLALQTLSDRLREQRDQLDAAALNGASAEAVGAQDPQNEVRDFFHERENHFPTLERLAEDIRQDAGLLRITHNHDAVEKLEPLLGATIKRMPPKIMGTILRRFDAHGGRLMVSEVLDRPSEAFQVCVQLILNQHRNALDQVLGNQDFHLPAARSLARQGLANYTAAAVLMPYQQFQTEALELRHDIDLLAQRFFTKREQVAHRLTTLQKPGAKGIPFFLIRVDQAGNVSKRFAAGGFHFARHGGTCPRWHIHEPAAANRDIRTDIVELPDNSKYLSLAIPCQKPSFGFGQPGQAYTIGLGCDAAHAKDLVYADGFNLESYQPSMIGVNCGLCERRDCSHRAFAPYHRNAVPDENRREVSAVIF